MVIVLRQTILLILGSIFGFSLITISFFFLFDEWLTDYPLFTILIIFVSVIITNLAYDENIRQKE